MTAAIDRLAVGDHVFVHPEDERSPIRFRGLDGVIAMLETTRAQIRMGGEGEELVWLELDLLALDRRHKKRRVKWLRGS